MDLKAFNQHAEQLCSKQQRDTSVAHELSTWPTIMQYHHKIDGLCLCLTYQFFKYTNAVALSLSARLCAAACGG